MSTKQIKQKLTATAGSSNFRITLITLALMFLSGMGAEVSPDLAGPLLDAVLSKDLFAMITIIVPNVVQPVFKIISNKTFNWRFLKNPNFYTQFFTVLFMGTAAFGLAFPDNAAMEVINSITGGNWTLILGAVSVNIINPLWHFFFEKRDGVLRPLISK